MVVGSQVDQWRFLYGLFLEDAAAVAEYRALDWQRQVVRPQVLQLLSSFLDKKISTALFTAILQRKAKGTWGVLGLRGLSTSMFLYKLIKHIPDTDTVTQYLQSFLPVPHEEDTALGKKAMEQFTSELERFISDGWASHYQLQPARVPFFLSVWWHIQSPEKWPIFYPSTRNAVLGNRDMILNDQISLYFRFRDRFNSLAETLGISIAELHYVWRWYENYRTDVNHPCHKISLRAYIPPANLQKDELTAKIISTSKAKSGPEDTFKQPKSKKTATRHAHLQWFLAKVGLKVGYQVWVGVNGQNMVWNDERLGDLGLDSLPFSGDLTLEQSIKQIDVLWLYKNEIIAAYEIEHDRKADVTVGLLRLSDLAACFPRRTLQFCIVAPQEQLGRIKTELPRPAFQKIRNLALLYEDALIKHHEHILRWANSPSIIQDLIFHVGDECQSTANASPR